MRKFIILFLVLIAIQADFSATAPTRAPSRAPSTSPTKKGLKTTAPTLSPTTRPPSKQPTGQPSGQPSSQPSKKQTVAGNAGATKPNDKPGRTAGAIVFTFVGLGILYYFYRDYANKKQDADAQKKLPYADDGATSGVEVNSIIKGDRPLTAKPTINPLVQSVA